MTDRDTERPTHIQPVGDDAGFLIRWSRRKRAIAAGAPLPEPVVAVPPAPVVDASTDDAPLIDPALLNFADDFTPYLKARVAPALKKAALKKLFADPSFNEIDGLDVYLEDYNLVLDLSAADLALLNHAKTVLRTIRGAETDDTGVAAGAVASAHDSAVAENDARQDESAQIASQNLSGTSAPEGVDPLDTATSNGSRSDPHT